MSKNPHVVPHDGGWAIKTEGSRSYISVFETKQDAIDAGRSIARSEGGELIVHGRNGQIFRSTPSSGIGEAAARAAVRSVSLQKRSAAKKSSKSSAGKKAGTKKSAAKKSARKK
jgi:hypothetical protein